MNLPPLLQKMIDSGEVEAGSVMLQVSRGSPCTGFDSPCGKPARFRRQNTQYAEEISNWVCMCDDCFDKNEEYWTDRWEEYYSGIL